MASHQRAMKKKIENHNWQLKDLPATLGKYGSRCSIPSWNSPRSWFLSFLRLSRLLGLLPLRSLGNLPPTGHVPHAGPFNVNIFASEGSPTESSSSANSSSLGTNLLSSVVNRSAENRRRGWWWLLWWLFIWFLAFNSLSSSVSGWSPKNEQLPLVQGKKSL